MDEFSRRQFLKSTAAVTALAGIGLAAPRTESPKGWDLRRAVNPAIDNLRVVGAINPAMITKDPLSWEMDAQNAVIATAEADRTLDAMAVALAQKVDPKEAWAAIFQKPAAKNWNQVRAAIKVNCNSKNNGRIAIISKVCRVLGDLGVPSGNIVIYDGRGSARNKYSPFVGAGLPAGVVVSDFNKALGGQTKIALPWGKSNKYACTRALADGSVDILINLANNKGCMAEVGKTTLTLKNHAGTFDPMPLHLGGGMDYLLAFNRSDAIMGATIARQQLCIVDSLWGMVKGPFGVPEKRLDCIVMGTFSPAVDYLTAIKIREPLLGATHSSIARFLTDFGYQHKDVGDLVMASV
jgi:hypothetical protein